VRGTVEAIERELLQDGFVLRYPTGPAGEAVDGLPGREGAFLACTFWLADNYALIGRLQDALTEAGPDPRYLRFENKSEDVVRERKE